MNASPSWVDLASLATRIVALILTLAIYLVVEALTWHTQQARTEKYHAISLKAKLRELMERTTRAPLVIFYKDWNPKSGQPRQTYLARHVTSHQFGPEQVTDRI